MARHESPEHLLKHPRTKRRSTTVPRIANPKRASIRKRKKWKPIVDAAMQGVLTNDNLDTLPIRNKMRIKWGPEGAPEGFPRAVVRNVDNSGANLYNCDLVLLYCYEAGLSDYSPTMLYKQRISYMRQMNEIEKQLNLDLDDLENE